MLVGERVPNHFYITINFVQMKTCSNIGFKR